MKHHKCSTCKIIYECTADECDEPYYLQCTPCEIKEYDAIQQAKIKDNLGFEQFFDQQKQILKKQGRFITMKGKRKLEEVWNQCKN